MEDILEHLAVFERHQNGLYDRYGAEVLHRAAAEITGLREKVRRYRPFVSLFRDLLDSCEDVLWCSDIDGGTFQDIATKHKVLVEGPCRTQQERDEWGEDATMYYLSDNAVDALADDGKGE